MEANFERTKFQLSPKILFYLLFLLQKKIIILLNSARDLNGVRQREICGN